MLKILALVLLGFSAGFLTGSWRASKPEQPLSAELASCEVPREPRLRVRTSTQNPTDEPKFVVIESFGELADLKDTVNLPQSQRAPHDVRAGFDESLLQEIESTIELTRLKVQLTRDSAGWRVRTLQSGSPLDRLALKEGDLITRINAEDPEFRARMEAVLDQLL